MSDFIHCWCGDLKPKGIMHYPGGDPENGPGHLPETEEQLRSRSADQATDRIMNVLSDDDPEHAAVIHEIIMEYMTC